MFLPFLRFIKGPNLVDRVVAFDTLGIIVVSLMMMIDPTLTILNYFGKPFNRTVM
jgi:multisubunit Na+/H+ antiporter MnhF subunit